MSNYTYCDCGFGWDASMSDGNHSCQIFDGEAVTPSCSIKIHNFDRIVKESLELTEKVLLKKGKEYARENRYSNFEKVGRRHSISPEQALWYLRDKHEASIDDMIKDLEKGKLPVKELIDEKITDDINYLLLLKGMLYRRIGL